MAYRIEFAPHAERDFRGLSKNIQIRLKPHIDKLAITPRPQGIEKLSGEDDLYRIRVGDYRLVYQIQDDVLLVLMVKIGHRREIYRKI
ncbi:MAG: type II toxin-antitoxin system RelE/ParE family toxin [Candidatus Schekmanbacteria bacterium]|nr:type II toxin-antitoxin system RelE/ParE family toxin [Candidatus Schekmanbacteria bacterium]